MTQLDSMVDPRADLALDFAAQWEWYLHQNSEGGWTRDHLDNYMVEVLLTAMRQYIELSSECDAEDRETCEGGENHG